MKSRPRPHAPHSASQLFLRAFFGSVAHERAAQTILVYQASCSSPPRRAGPKPSNTPTREGSVCERACDPVRGTEEVKGEAEIDTPRVSVECDPEGADKGC